MENMSYAQFGYAAFTPTTQVSLNFILLITLYRNLETNFIAASSHCVIILIAKI